jgi:hypothetical protein
MRLAQLLKLVTVASYWWVSIGTFAHAEKIWFIAKQDNTCQINNFTAGELAPSSNPPTKLTGTYSISIGCQGNATGNLRLNFTPAVVYNGEATMQFISNSGVLAGASSIPPASTMIIPISSNGAKTGDGLIRVSIVAPPGRLLRAASNYQIVIDATILP